MKIKISIYLAAILVFLPHFSPATAQQCQEKFGGICRAEKCLSEDISLGNETGKYGCQGNEYCCVLPCNSQSITSQIGPTQCTASSACSNPLNKTLDCQQVSGCNSVCCAMSQATGGIDGNGGSTDIGTFPIPTGTSGGTINGIPIGNGLGNTPIGGTNNPYGTRSNPLGTGSNGINPATGTNQANPAASNASGTSSGGIVPCGKSGAAPCTLCHLIQGFQNLINWGKNIIVIVAIVGIVIAGLLYMLSSGSESMTTLSKNCFKASLIGFTVSIAAWLIINTVLFTIISAKKDLGVGGSWNSFSCDKTSTAGSGGGTTPGAGNQQTPAQAAAQQQKNQDDCDKYCDAGGDGLTDNATCKSTCMADKNSQQVASNNPAPTGEGLAQSDAQQRLDECGARYASANTLNGVRDTTVSELCGFADSSGCSPMVSTHGGTNGGHASGTYSHANGYKFDFLPDSCNDSYIQNNYPYTGTRSDGATCYSAPSGACYSREGDHWDMSSGKSCKAQGC